MKSLKINLSQNLCDHLPKIIFIGYIKKHFEI